MAHRSPEALPTSSSALPGLHRRGEQTRGGSAAAESGQTGHDALGRFDRHAVGKARRMLRSRWQILSLAFIGLLLMFTVARHDHSSSALMGGVAIRGIRSAGERPSGETSARPRALVEQHDPLPAQQSTLSSLAAKAADLVAGRAAASPPPSPIPEAWLEGGTLGTWPKPYRNKTRQVVPNSVWTWKCTPDAANFSLAAATHNPLLQSTEWRHRYGDDVSLFKWCREGLPEEVPQLEQVLKLESAKPRPARGLTVVTQLSLERFQMLENQCSTWPLQISAVLYIPLVKGRIFSAEEPVWNKVSLDVGVAEALAFHAAMEASNTSCILDLEVVVEERCDRYSAMLYPANAARNRALVSAKTEAMLLVDVDFAVSQSLADLVTGEASYKRLMSMLHGRNAVVLPAFETQDDGEQGRRVALEAVRKGKPYVVKQFEWNHVFGFHVPQYPQGHQPTDYWRWINSHAAYPVQYQIGYEPYILMHRDYIPFYDERFRGYYWNKVQHLMHISLQNGFNFLVHPTAFVVHVPHKKPSTKWLTRKMGQKEKNHMLFDNALFHMRQMDFVPVTSWPDMCMPEVAPPLPGEDEAREIAAMKAAAERAAAEQAEAAMRQHAVLQEAAAAAAAKRAAELAEAEAWIAQNSEAAEAANKQQQQATIETDATYKQHQQQLAVAAAAQQMAAAAAAAAASAQAAAQQAGDNGQAATAAEAAQAAAARAAVAADRAEMEAAAEDGPEELPTAGAAGQADEELEDAVSTSQQVDATVQQQPALTAAAVDEQAAANAGQQHQEPGGVSQPADVAQPAATQQQQAASAGQAAGTAQEAATDSAQAQQQAQSAGQAVAQAATQPLQQQAAAVGVDLQQPQQQESQQVSAVQQAQQGSATEMEGDESAEEVEPLENELLVVGGDADGEDDGEGSIGADSQDADSKEVLGQYGGSLEYGRSATEE